VKKIIPPKLSSLRPAGRVKYGVPLLSKLSIPANGQTSVEVQENMPIVAIDQIE
jgi:hypothetical protein